MRIVIDTNVLISGVFFGGYPGQFSVLLSDGRSQRVPPLKSLMTAVPEFYPILHSEKYAPRGGGVILKGE